MTGRLVKDINPNGSSSPEAKLTSRAFFISSQTQEHQKALVTTARVATRKEEDQSKPDSGKVTAAKAERLLRSFDGVSNLVEANGFVFRWPDRR